MGEKNKPFVPSITDILRLGDPIQVITNGVVETGVFIAINRNQLLWVRHDENTSRVHLVYSPFNQVSIERL